jgi:hypothetical protein
MKHQTSSGSQIGSPSVLDSVSVSLLVSVLVSVSPPPLLDSAGLQNFKYDPGRRGAWSGR